MLLLSPCPAAQPAALIVQRQLAAAGACAPTGRSCGLRSAPQPGPAAACGQQQGPAWLSILQVAGTCCCAGHAAHCWIWLDLHVQAAISHQPCTGNLLVWCCMLCKRQCNVTMHAAQHAMVPHSTPQQVPRGMLLLFAALSCICVTSSSLSFPICVTSSSLSAAMCAAAVSLPAELRCPAASSDVCSSSLQKRDGSMHKLLDVMLPRWPRVKHTTHPPSCCCCWLQQQRLVTGRPGLAAIIVNCI